MTTLAHKTTAILAATILALAVLAAPAQAASKEKEKKAAAAAQQAGQLVWPMPPDKPRLRFLRELTNNFDIETPKKKSWVDKMVGNPDPNVVDRFEKPAGIATDSRNRIIFASLQKSVVFVLDPEHKTVQKIQGDRGIMLQTPLGVVVDPQDNIIVSDPFQHMILKFDRDGHLLQTAGQSDHLKNPSFMALDNARKRLYVVDGHRHQVMVYNSETLTLETSFGKRGERNGDFNFPVGIAVAQDGTIAVSDTGSCSVELFTPDFKFIRRIGKQGDRPGEFIRPKAVAIDDWNNVWVVDAAFNNVQIFDNKGVLLMWVGQFGNVPGAFNLPLGIYIAKNQKVYVSDQLNHRVQVFQYLGGD